MPIQDDIVHSSLLHGKLYRIKQHSTVGKIQCELQKGAMLN